MPDTDCGCTPQGPTTTLAGPWTAAPTAQPREVGANDAGEEDVAERVERLWNARARRERELRDRSIADELRMRAELDASLGGWGPDLGDPDCPGLEPLPPEIAALWRWERAERERWRREVDQRFAEAEYRTWHPEEDIARERAEGWWVGEDETEFTRERARVLETHESSIGSKPSKRTTEVLRQLGALPCCSVRWESNQLQRGALPSPTLVQNLMQFLGVAYRAIERTPSGDEFADTSSTPFNWFRFYQVGHEIIPPVGTWAEPPSQQVQTLLESSCSLISSFLLGRWVYQIKKTELYPKDWGWGDQKFRSITERLFDRLRINHVKAGSGTYRVSTFWEYLFSNQSLTESWSSKPPPITVFAVEPERLSAWRRFTQFCTDSPADWTRSFVLEYSQIGANNGIQSVIETAFSTPLLSSTVAKRDAFPFPLNWPTAFYCGLFTPTDAASIINSGSHKNQARFIERDDDIIFFSETITTVLSDPSQVSALIDSRIPSWVIATILRVGSLRPSGGIVDLATYLRSVAATLKRGINAGSSFHETLSAFVYAMHLIDPCALATSGCDPGYSELAMLSWALCGRSVATDHEPVWIGLRTESTLFSESPYNLSKQSEPATPLILLTREVAGVAGNFNQFQYGITPADRRTGIDADLAQQYEQFVSWWNHVQPVLDIARTLHVLRSIVAGMIRIDDEIIAFLMPNQAPSVPDDLSAQGAIQDTEWPRSDLREHFTESRSSTSLDDRRRPLRGIDYAEAIGLIVRQVFSDIVVNYFIDEHGYGGCLYELFPWASSSTQRSRIDEVFSELESITIYRRDLPLQAQQLFQTVFRSGEKLQLRVRSCVTESLGGVLGQLFSAYIERGWEGFAAQFADGRNRRSFLSWYNDASRDYTPFTRIEWWEPAWPAAEREIPEELESEERT